MQCHLHHRPFLMNSGMKLLLPFVQEESPNQLFVVIASVFDTNMYDTELVWGGGGGVSLVTLASHAERTNAARVRGGATVGHFLLVAAL